MMLLLSRRAKEMAIALEVTLMREKWLLSCATHRLLCLSYELTPGGFYSPGEEIARRLDVQVAQAEYRTAVEPTHADRLC